MAVAPTSTGHVVTVGASALSGSTSITVPADATFATIEAAGYYGQSTPTNISAATISIGGVGSTYIGAGIDGTSDGDQSGAHYVKSPPTGTQTFSWHWGTAAWGDGGGVVIKFWKGVDLTTPIGTVTTNYKAGVISPGTVTLPALTVAAGDYVSVVGYFYNVGGTRSWSGVTEDYFGVVSGTSGSDIGSASSAQASAGTVTPGVTYTQASSSQYIVLTGYVIKAAAVSTPVSGSDSGTGADTEALTAQEPLTDTGAGSEASSTAAQITGPTDSAAGTDSASVSNSGSPAFSDSGAGSDAEGITAQESITDSSAGTDALAIQVSLAESGAGTDSLTAPTAQISLAENATGADSALRTGVGSKDTIYQWYGGTGKSGVIDSYTRQVVRLPNGQVYAFIIDDWGHQQATQQKDFLVALKADGIPVAASATEVGGHQLVDTAGDVFSTPDCRLDSSGIVHMVYQHWRASDNRQQLRYAQFDTNTDTWTVIGEVVATSGLAYISHAWKRSFGASALSLDASGTPHVVYATQGGSILYTKRTGVATWAATTTISSTEAGSPGPVHMQSQIDSTGKQIIVWATQETNTKIRYAERTGTTWSAAETVRQNTDSGGVWTVSDFDQVPAIGQRPNGNSLVYYLDGSHVQKVSERTGVGAYTIHDVGIDTHAGTLYTANDDWYCFEGHQIPTSGNLHPAYTYSLNQGTSWAAEIVFPPSGATSQDQDGSASVRYDLVYDPYPSIIDWLAWDERSPDGDTNHFGIVYYVAVTPQRISSTISDSGTGSATGTISATAALSDAGAETDTAAAVITQSGNDTGAGTDSSTAKNAAGISDSAAGTDGASVSSFGNPAFSDAGGGTDSVSVIVKVTMTDTSGAVVEIPACATTTTFSDSGAGAEGGAASVQFSIADASISSSEALPAPTVSATTSDNGLSTETVSGNFIIPGISDSGTGTDTGRMTHGIFIIGGKRLILSAEFDSGRLMGAEIPVSRLLSGEVD